MFNKKWLTLGIVSSFTLSLDQILKVLIHTQFKLHESIIVIPSFFNITYVRNYGAAFGILSSTSEIFRKIFFLSIPPLACVLLLALIYQFKTNQKKEILACSFIFAGALGNFIDRWQYGYVVDFIDFHLDHKWNWPAFNIADVAIVAGVLYLLIGYYKLEKIEKNKVVLTEQE